MCRVRNALIRLSLSLEIIQKNYYRGKIELKVTQIKRMVACDAEFNIFTNEITFNSIITTKQTPFGTFATLKMYTLHVNESRYVHEGKRCVSLKLFH